MCAERRQDNLERLLRETDALCPSCGPLDAARLSLCGRLANGLPLAHSRPSGEFAVICRSGRLLSKQELDRIGIKRIDPAKPPVEMAVGTLDSIFLFAGPFRYPDTECGFLFSAAMETDATLACAANPFDSGGLVRHHCPPDGEAPIGFLARHELPAPGYRRLLARNLDRLFTDPWHYVDGTGPSREGPVRLVSINADQRRWTFEVRVTKEMTLRTHLQAIFASAAASEGEDVQKMIYWCETNGVDVQLDATPLGSTPWGFEQLKNKCAEYLQRKLRP